MACTAVTLAGLTLDCEGTLGGIKKVWITDYSNIASVTVEQDEIASISLKDSAKWYSYEFRKETGSMTSTLTVDNQTGINYVTTELSLVFTKMETKKRIEMTALSIGQLAVVVLDTNGHYWFLGKDDYVSASAGGGNTGTAKSDQNAYTLTLSTESETYPFELSDTAIEALV